ncbi:MAG: hypothetical protein LRY37_05670 [Alkalibacterium thalassium]|nr:hypothetical protein [Alkalibacterium thalassium]
MEIWEPTLEEAAVEVEPWALPQDRFAAGGHGSDILCMQRVGAWLQNQLQRGVVMPSTGKPLRYGDVLIVVQRNRIGTLAAGVLRGMGIPVAAAGLVSQPVRDVVCLVRTVFNPHDRIALCAVLKAFHNWNDAQLLDLAARGWLCRSVNPPG